MIYLAVACAGGLGALSRYLIDKNVPPTPFPLSTFLINIAGSFLIGAIYVLGTEKGILTKEMAAMIATGFIGGFTTFSAYALQTVVLAENGQAAIAAAYFVASPIVSALFAFGGIWLTRTFT
jgi:CrcB protein